MAFKSTAYFQSTRTRDDRQSILDEWIEAVLVMPEREFIQADQRIRIWRKIQAAEGRYLRLVVLPDGETVHDAFFDRGFKP
jgi:hypothetical protein